ncbi:MAG: virulence factor family protein [Actinomycetia bacterium]|nr:virulence factor family protein [Actinomycetes bacterium]
MERGSCLRAATVGAGLVQTNDAELTEASSPDVPPAMAPRLTAGIAQGAALIAGLTLVSRILGLVRTLVFSQTVGSGCLGTIYVTSYQVPNLLSELVLAGALTNAMVPVLARSAQRAGTDAAARERIAQISSAMLTWTVLILVPVMIIIVAAAGPIAGLLNPSNASSHCVRSQMVGATSGMLEVFAPQVVLYGLSVVMFGMLQAYRRFTGPALAPIVASLVMITSYVIFVPLDGGAPLSRAPQAALLTLSVGATLNVAALVAVGLVPVRRLGLRLRPTLRFPRGQVGRLGGLAFVGVLEFIAIDIATVVVIVLANGHGDTGALVVLNYAMLVFNAVSAVLAVSITTSAFPVMSASDGDAFDRTCAGSTRAVVLMSWLGAAVIAAVAVPAAHILVHGGQVTELIEAFAAMAPGIVGVAVITNLSRVLFVLGRLRVAALALTGSWLLAVAVDAVLTQFVPAHLEVAALGIGSSIGQTAVAIPLVFATRRIRGKAALAGAGRATLAGFVACVVASVGGVAVIIAMSPASKSMFVIAAVLATACAIAAFAAVAYLLVPGDLRSIAVAVASRRARAQKPRGRDGYVV